jgi:formate/nitrite transporter
MSKHCQFWQEYDSIAGGISYCELAAFNKPVNPAFLAHIGCHEEKRKQCLGVVTNDLAFYIGDGMSRLVGGATFSIGLILVILGGAELFTGNNMIMTTGLLQKRITLKQVMTNWSLVYVFNFIGALLFVYLIFYSGIWNFNGGSVGERAVGIAVSKVSLTWSEAFSRGILCNWLVCMAVWLSLAGKDAFGKILGIMIPVTAFVALGLEHSIANMYFIPMGILLAGQETVRAAMDPVVLQGLTWTAFLWKNLLPVTLGNMVGGIIFVAIAYWNVYLRIISIDLVTKLWQDTTVCKRNKNVKRNGGAGACISANS